MLRQPAIAMAKQSTYRCPGCKTVQALTLTYEFTLIDSVHDLPPGRDPCAWPGVPIPPTTLTRHLDNRITITAGAPYVCT